MSLNAGKLNHHVRIDRFDYVLDSNGDQIQDPVTGEILQEWQFVADVWAKIEPVSVRELIASQSIQSNLSARATIRYRTDVDAKCRIVHRGKVYNVSGTLPDKESGLEYLTLPLSEGLSDGA